MCHSVCVFVCVYQKCSCGNLTLCMDGVGMAWVGIAASTDGKAAVARGRLLVLLFVCECKWACVSGAADVGDDAGVLLLDGLE